MCPKTFVNSSALLMSLTALRSRHETKTPFGLVDTISSNTQNIMFLNLQYLITFGGINSFVDV